MTEQNYLSFPLLSQLTIDAVQAEALRAHLKHGPKGKSLLNSDMPVLEKLAAVGKEFGEVCRALTYDQDHSEGLVKELLQLANTALSWVESIEGENRSQFRVSAPEPVVSFEGGHLTAADIVRSLAPRICHDPELHQAHGWGETIGNSTRGYYCAGRTIRARPIQDVPQA